MKPTTTVFIYGICLLGGIIYLAMNNHPWFALGLLLVLAGGLHADNGDEKDV